MIGKMRDKIIIFDWGGVIESNVAEEYNIYVAISNIIKQCNIKMDEREFLNTLYKNNEICNNIENIEKWFQTLKLNCSFEEFLRIYKKETSKVHYYKEVVLLAQSLKKYCNIAILSNIILLDKSRLNNQIGLNNFDYVWLSFEIGLTKPDENIYKLVERECKISPNNILFIDDKEENIVCAQKRGWNVCHAKGDEFSKIEDSVYKFLNN